MYNKNISFHFVGIGGSGMSGIAEILLRRGFHVSGSDLHSSPMTRYLQTIGTTVHIGHRAENIGPNTSLVVISSAVGEENEEVREARRLGIPVIRRAEVLAELLRLKFGIAVAGSHGKTTTTSMIAWVLEHAGLDPTIIIGGIVQSIGSGGKDGDGQFLVAESDESDRSFLLLKPTIAVITNVDDEHLRAYSSKEDLLDSFQQFANSVPFYGIAVCCIDDPATANITERLTCRKCTYGLHEAATVRAVDIRTTKSGTRFLLVVRGKVLGTVEAPLLGVHNVQNTLAAVAVALEIGIDPAMILSALELFPGVKRRMETLASTDNFDFMSDYAHHPSEISQTISALRTRYSQVHVVFQPHRFSRLRDCYSGFLECFDAADSVTITDVYPAGEQPIEGMSSKRLVQDLLQRASSSAAVYHASHAGTALQKLAGAIGSREPVQQDSADEKNGESLLSSRQVLVCLGAGSIGAEAEEFAGSLSSASPPTNAALAG